MKDQPQEFTVILSALNGEGEWIERGRGPAGDFVGDNDDALDLSTQLEVYMLQPGESIIINMGAGGVFKVKRPTAILETS